MKDFIVRTIVGWICIGSIIISLFFLTPHKKARADLFGGDVAVLTQILVQAINTVTQLRNVLQASRETVGILDEMNRGVKEVLRLAKTAHIPLPPQVYEKAKQLDEAVNTARQFYGVIPERAHAKEKVQYQSGVEALFLSQDAFEYSTFLDNTGESVKSSAIVANQSSATRLTAETLGVVLQAISHSNRIQAKSLEIEATERVENSTREAARYENFLDSHSAFQNQLSSPAFSPLTPIWGEGDTGRNGRTP